MTNAAFSSRIATGLAACAFAGDCRGSTGTRHAPNAACSSPRSVIAPRAEITQPQCRQPRPRRRRRGANNQLDLTQEGSAAHRAEIAQGGDDNTASAVQDGEGSTDLALAQEGNGNSAILFQREQSPRWPKPAPPSSSAGNGNSIILAQDGSDNEALADPGG